MEIRFTTQDRGHCLYYVLANIVGVESILKESKYHGTFHDAYRLLQRYGFELTTLAKHGIHSEPIYDEHLGIDKSLYYVTDAYIKLIINVKTSLDGLHSMYGLYNVHTGRITLFDVSSKTPVLDNAYGRDLIEKYSVYEIEAVTRNNQFVIFNWDDV